MSEYKLKIPKAVEAVVEVQKKIEDTVVGAYKKVEGKFVDAFWESATRSHTNTIPQGAKLCGR